MGHIASSKTASRILQRGGQEQKDLHGESSKHSGVLDVADQLLAQFIA